MMTLMKATNWKHADEGCKSKYVSQKSQVVHKCCWNFNLCRVLTDHSPTKSKESKGILAGITSTHRATICPAWRSLYSQRDFLACPWAVFSFIFQSFFLCFWEMFQRFDMTNATATPQNQTAAIKQQPALRESYFLPFLRAEKSHFLLFHRLKSFLKVTKCKKTVTLNNSFNNTDCKAISQTVSPKWCFHLFKMFTDISQGIIESFVESHCGL